MYTQRIIALLLVALAHATPGFCDDTDDAYELQGNTEAQVAQPPSDQVAFDLSRLGQLGLAEALRNHFIPADAKPLIPQRKELLEQNFPLFFELVRVFDGYLRSFIETRDATYPTLSDFRSTYLHKLSSEYPQIQVQAETYQDTTDFHTIIVKTQGAGGGLRFNFMPGADQTVSLVAMPLYGEERDFSPQGMPLPGGTDYILRASTGVVYNKKFGKHVEPGFQVYFQPQVVDLTEFRVYTEAYIRFKILDDNPALKRVLRLQDITLLPKVVFWKTTDQGGIYGDDIQNLLGTSVYSSLNHVIYGFLNIQVHINL